MAIGGKWILPEASCKKCERVTGRTESIALNNHLVGPRRRLGLRGRTRVSEAVKELPVFVTGPNGDVKVMIPVEDHPSALFFLRLNTPPVIDRLLGRWFEPPSPVGVFVKILNLKEDVLKERYGITEWATPSLDLYTFCRMLAKIGHSYAIAKLGIGSFHPVLTQSILEEDRNSARVLPFVGGVPDEPEEAALHTVQEGTIRVAGIEMVGVRIRLFAQFGAPTYLVVVGTKGKGPEVLPIGFPVGGDVPHSMSKVIVPGRSDHST